MAEYATTLLTILSNQLLLLSTTPYLSALDIHSLSQSCRSAYNILASSPSVHRYLDLSVTHRSKDVPRILSAPRILRSTRTLVLDNLPVTTELLYSLITPVGWQSEIQLLSLRGCKNINEREFMSFLSYLVRPSRPEGSLKLKGVYWFSDPEATTGRFVKNPKLRLGSEWTALLKACEGIISFDTRVCQGHRHESSFEDEYLEPKLANIKLEGGCAGCGFTPHMNANALPSVLIAPAPLFGRAEAACTGTDGKQLGDVLRCEDCVKERWCECCGKWWCESCAVAKKYVNRTCFECGTQCEECTTHHSRICSSCRGGYCITHNEGADNLRCEWCNAASAPRRGSFSNPLLSSPAPVPRRGSFSKALLTSPASVPRRGSFSNAFLTSPASSYYLSLGPAHAHRPSTGSPKPRTVGSGTPFRAATNVPIGGRQFQQEMINRNRGHY